MKCPYCGKLITTELQERIILELSVIDNKDGLTGSMLSKELGVTHPTIIKATKLLIQEGIITKTSLQIAPNIKIYKIRSEHM